MILNKENAIKPEQLALWLQKPSTKRLLELEAGWLKHWVAQFFGYHIAYTGIDPKPKFLRHSRVQHKFCLGLPWGRGVTAAEALIGDGEWPLPNNCLDVVIMQHSLDISAHPHQLLRNASRCLVSGGYLVIVGFNPLSAWGLARWMHIFSPRMPWLTRPVSPARLQDWLVLLDMKIERQSAAAHFWPLSLGNEQLNKRIDRVLYDLRWLPANAYVMVARKTTAGMTPIRQKRWALVQKPFTLPVAAASKALHEMSKTE